MQSPLPPPHDRSGREWPLGLQVIMMEAHQRVTSDSPIHAGAHDRKIVRGRLHQCGRGLGVGPAATAGPAALCMAVPTLPRLVRHAHPTAGVPFLHWEAPSALLTARYPLSRPAGWAGSWMPWEGTSATWWVTWLFRR